MAIFQELPVAIILPLNSNNELVSIESVTLIIESHKEHDIILWWKSAMERTKLTCDRVLASNKKIRHVGYYDSFGKILCDSSREKLAQLEGEGVEEMHILNGTAASTLVLWKRSSYLLGKLNAFIMILGKIVDLIVPDGDTGSYFLVVFDNDATSSEVEQARMSLVDELKSH
jgi:hypothetical protein